MRTHIYRASLITVAISVMIASGAAIYYTKQSENIAKKSISRETQFMYYLKEHEEKIGVYRVNEETPFKTLEVYVNTLPYVDRIALSEGIEVADDEKLNVLIEDYES